ncbi:MAG: cytochrome C oxidase subunit IV [Dehalococcoidia bacterium]|nr:cytochrome C oxidase subunit IV [Dehalococcoidia bacterium]MQG16589.1 cytochrome C oxidase subunit IV [SAR202 cluster bacterium]|tara:strand:- start:96147 stop:96491 length:345 start_codon:yes stop_codon:yes gene_type:complete
MVTENIDNRTPHNTSDAASHADHPTAGTYFKVAMALCILTALEVIAFEWFEWLSYGIIPVLGILSVIKFYLVIQFYMHLKFDHKLFSTLFLTGLFLAIGVTFALMALFRWFHVS